MIDSNSGKHFLDGEEKTFSKLTAILRSHGIRARVACSGLFGKISIRREEQKRFQIGNDNTRDKAIDTPFRHQIGPMCLFQNETFVKTHGLAEIRS